MIGWGMVLQSFRTYYLVIHTFYQETTSSKLYIEDIEDKLSNTFHLVTHVIIFLISQIEEIEDKLSSKKMSMEELQENEKLLYDSFTEQLGENNKFADFLTKVFKKKIKRVKKATEMEGGNVYELNSNSHDFLTW